MWKHLVSRWRVSPLPFPAVPAAFFSTKGPSNSIRDSTKQLKSWESGARMVKNTKIENQYLEVIRDTHDPSHHIKTIEDELKGTIGKALGKQGEKVNMFLRAMEKEKKAYLKLLGVEKRDSADPKVVEVVTKFNAYRKDGIQARWELIVHRQAVGFTVREYVLLLLFGG
jgi:nicotinamide mononucleotide adenylyltransferase